MSDVLGIMVEHRGQQTVRSSQIGTRVSFSVQKDGDIGVSITKDCGKELLAYAPLSRQSFVDLYETCIELARRADEEATGRV